MRPCSKVLGEFFNWEEVENNVGWTPPFVNLTTVNLQGVNCVLKVGDFSKSCIYSILDASYLVLLPAKCKQGMRYCELLILHSKNNTASLLAFSSIVDISFQSVSCGCLFVYRIVLWRGNTAITCYHSKIWHKRNAHIFEWNFLASLENKIPYESVFHQNNCVPVMFFVYSSLVTINAAYYHNLFEHKPLWLDMANLCPQQTKVYLFLHTFIVLYMFIPLIARKFAGALPYLPYGGLASCQRVSRHII